MFDLDKCIVELDIETKLNKILFYPNVEEYSLEWGMNYITFLPSKRVRPILVLETNKIFSPIDDDSYILAAAVELIHTYSLVHDDLPCMDDDALRRGKPTLHTIKDEAYALLVGDALLTRVMEILSKYSKIEKLPFILGLFADYTGKDGMIKGQVLDLDGEGKSLTVEEINLINKNKTGALIKLSMLLGAVNGNAGDGFLSTIKTVGDNFGAIFQLVDDLLDLTGDEAVLGKSIGSDEKNQKSSIPLVIGVEETKNILNACKKELLESVEKLPANGKFFTGFTDFLLNRDK